MKISQPLASNNHHKWSFSEVYGKSERYVKTYFHDLKKDSNLTLPIHNHSFYEINIIFEGTGTHIINQKNIPVKKGDVFVIPHNFDHGYSTEHNLIIYHILLSDIFLETFSQFFDCLPGYELLFHIEPILRAESNELFFLQLSDNDFDRVVGHINNIEDSKKATYSKDNLEQAVFVLSLITTLLRLIYFSKSINTSSLSNLHAINILTSVKYIEDHYEQKISFEEEAKKMGLAYSSYVRVFKKFTGTSPIKYQIDYRIKKAKYMLLHSNDSILNIALACGFYDSPHFTREFKKRENISPQKYRSKN